MAQQARVTVTWDGVEGVGPVEFAYLEDGPADGPLALCLHGFPDHAPTWSAVLIGHDWGAIASYGAVNHRPERFQKLVAMSVPHGASLGARMFTSPAQLKRSWYMYFFQLPLAAMAVQANDFAFIDKLWRDWSPGWEPPAEHLRAVKDILAAPGGLDAAIGYYRHLLNPLHHDPRLADAEAAASGWVNVPTLYVHGAGDGCVGADMVADDMKNLFPAGLEVEMFPGLGHFLHLEDPAKVNRRILEFLTAGS